MAKKKKPSSPRKARSNRSTTGSRSGGIDISSTATTVGGDVVGRDKIDAGGHIVHAGPGATVIINEPSTPAPQDLPQDPHYYDEAVQKYLQRMRDRYSTTRMLGKPEPVSLKGIFTDVYVLDRPTALQRFDIEELKIRRVERGSFGNDAKRISALRLASQQDHLLILGKPGAGKTTFLKYLTLQAATGKLDRVPIFIMLNEWAGSGQEILPFIQRQFDICAFPDAQPFIQRLLNHGEALVCFDGLDEVNEADDKRAAITRAIGDFTNKYPKNKYLITCRIAATDYTFEKFTYVEMADFTPKQVQVFARKWFAGDEAKAQRFVDELSHNEHRGLRELAQTPLLLTLLCLAFEEKLTFPARRAELYEEALDALLKKWDAARNLKRDQMYRGLSLNRKRQLFAHVAAEYFERGDIFFHQNDLAQRVSAFLKNLPNTEAADEPDGEAVLVAVEAQHGIFVERAHLIYSFSHLTLQEYFTARYVVDHAADGAVERLIKQHVTDDRWREVLLLTASMLPLEAAGVFFATFQRALDDMLRGDERLLAYGRWAADKATDYAYLGHPAIARAAARVIARLPDLAADRKRDYSHLKSSKNDNGRTTRYQRRVRLQAEKRDRPRDSAHNRALTLTLARALDRDSDFECYLDLARAPNPRVDYYDLVSVLNAARACAFDLARALDLDCARDHDLDRDLAFTFTWHFARLESRARVRQLMMALAQASQPASQSELEFVHALNALDLPTSNKWKAYVANLRALLIRYRNIGHEWNFTKEQQQHIDQYERGTVFLAECLKLATVSDRKAIENRLLLPPNKDEFYVGEGKA